MDSSHPPSLSTESSLRLCSNVNAYSEKPAPAKSQDDIDWVPSLLLPTESTTCKLRRFTIMLLDSFVSLHCFGAISCTLTCLHKGNR